MKFGNTRANFADPSKPILFAVDKRVRLINISLQAYRLGVYVFPSQLVEGVNVPILVQPAEYLLESSEYPYQRCPEICSPTHTPMLLWHSAFAHCIQVQPLTVSYIHSKYSHSFDDIKLNFHERSYWRVFRSYQPVGYLIQSHTALHTCVMYGLAYTWQGLRYKTPKMFYWLRTTIGNSFFRNYKPTKPFRCGFGG